MRALGLGGEAVEDGGYPDMVRGQPRQQRDGEDGGLDRDETQPEHELEDAACVTREAVSVRGGEEERPRHKSGEAEDEGPRSLC